MWQGVSVGLFWRGFCLSPRIGIPGDGIDLIGDVCKKIGQTGLNTQIPNRLFKFLMVL